MPVAQVRRRAAALDETGSERRCADRRARL